MAQQAEAQSTPSKKPSKKPNEPRFGPRLPKFPKAGFSKEDAEYARDQGWFDISPGEGPSDSGDSTEKHHQEKCLRSRAEETKRHRQGLAMTGKKFLLVDAGARAKLLGEGELSNLDRSPWEIDICVTVNGYSEPFCWIDPLLASTTSVRLQGHQDSQRS